MRQVRASIGGFYWNRRRHLLETGNAGLEVAPGFWLRWGPDIVAEDESALISEMLSDDQRDEMRKANWLCFDQSDDDGIQPQAVVFCFQVALWLITPARSISRFRFVLEVGPGIPHNLPPSFHLGATEFQPNKGQWRDEVTTNELLEAGQLLPAILDIARRGGRLNTSLLLTFHGCISHHLMPTFLCWSAAAEAMLTYYPKHSTPRMARTFAALTESDLVERNRAFVEFRRLYKVRSGITHGRGYSFTDTPGNLANLAAMADLLRRTWRAILARPGLLAELEEGDLSRELAYDEVEWGYEPPGAADELAFATYSLPCEVQAAIRQAARRQNVSPAQVIEALVQANLPPASTLPVPEAEPSDSAVVPTHSPPSSPLRSTPSPRT